MSNSIWGGDDVKEAMEKMKDTVSNEPDKLKALNEYFDSLHGGFLSKNKRKGNKVDGLNQTNPYKKPEEKLKEQTPRQKKEIIDNIYKETEIDKLRREVRDLQTSYAYSKDTIRQLRTKLDGAQNRIKELEYEESRPINGTCETCKTSQQVDDKVFRCRFGVFASMFASVAERHNFDYSCENYDGPPKKESSKAILINGAGI